MVLAMSHTRANCRLSMDQRSLTAPVTPPIATGIIKAIRVLITTEVPPNLFLRESKIAVSCSDTPPDIDPCRLLILGVPYYEAVSAQYAKLEPGGKGWPEARQFRAVSCAQ